jgi:hypothetical protein
MKTLLVSSALVLISTAVLAQNQTMEDCKIFDDDNLRLVCYDKLSGYEKAEAETGNSDGSNTDLTSGGWVFKEQDDEFSGKETSYAFLESDAATAVLTDKPKAIIIRCDGKGGNDIYVLSNGYIGGDRIRVRYKFGESKPVSERWMASTDGQAAFLPNGYKDFLSGLLSGDDFIFELTDFNGSTSMARFKNAAKNIEKRNYVLAGCKK